jgi:gas vesicle protein
MMHETQEHTNYNFALGLLCGVAVGAALGLLFAPSDGKQLRGKVGESAKWLGNQSKEVYDRASRTVSDAMSAGRDAFHKTRTDATASADM